MTDSRSNPIEQTIDEIYQIANEPGFAQLDSNIKLRQLVHVLRREINEDRADAPNAFAGINDDGTPRLTPFFVEYGIFTSFPDQAPQLGRFEHPSGKAALAAAVRLFHERFPGQYGYVKVGDASGDQDEEAEVAPVTASAPVQLRRPDLQRLEATLLAVTDAVIGMMERTHFPESLSVAGSLRLLKASREQIVDSASPEAV